MPLHTLTRGSRRYSLNDVSTASGAGDVIAADWADRVVINGGLYPSGSTISALTTFWNTILVNQMDSKMIVVNCFVPDNLPACLTPLIKGVGADPWNNINFVTADLTTGGLIGNASSKYLNTGVIPSVAVPDDTSWGISCYHITSDSNAAFSDMGAYNSSTQETLFYLDQNGTSYFDCWNISNGQGRVQAANTGFAGFMSANRTATNDIAIYKASSTVPFTALVNGTGAGGTRTTVYPLFLYCINLTGTPTNYVSRRFSFMSIHYGLTSAQSQILYNAVQAMRTTLGGGYL